METNLGNTKVLLLGYTGYIGATLAKVLLEKNIQVVCPVRNKKPPKKNENIVFVDMSQIESFLETSKEDIIQFVRSKAAVKKYK